MINMLRADFYRIFRSCVIYIAAVVMLAMVGMSLYLVEPGSIGIRVEPVVDVESSLDGMTSNELNDLSMSDFRKIMLKSRNYELDKDILAYNVNLYYIFIFVAALAITVDFSGNSIKNTLSSAISRRKYFFSKLAIVYICCLALFFLNTYIVYFGNIIFNNKNLASDIGTVTTITLLQIPSMLAFISILSGMAFITKKTAVFNTITIPLLILIQVLLSILTKFDISEKIYDYELQGMIAKLAYDPSKEYIMKSYAVCAVIAILFVLAGWLSFRRSEIK